MPRPAPLLPAYRAAYAAAMATRKTPSKKAAASPSKAAPRRAPRKRAVEEATPRSREIPAIRSSSALPNAERERRFNMILQAACMKAGTAAAISTITAKVPFLGRLTPVVLGTLGETLVLSKVQQQLVREVITLYGVELSDVEERGVILLATAANIGAQQLSKTTVDQLVRQLGGVLYRPVLARVLPLASVAAEIAAAVASTYAVGKRAQALCKLPGTGAKDLSQLLRGLTGIDQTRLFKWSSEALGMALKPFRGALSALIPGLS